MWLRRFGRLLLLNFATTMMRRSFSWLTTTKQLHHRGFSCWRPTNQAQKSVRRQDFRLSSSSNTSSGVNGLVVHGITSTSLEPSRMHRNSREHTISSYSRTSSTASNLNSSELLLLESVQANLEMIRQRASSTATTSRAKVPPSDEATDSRLSSAHDPCLFLLGVSGGCDSMALFHLMRQVVCLDEERRYKQASSDKASKLSNAQLHVVHFDHQQRGIHSDADRLLVQQLCQQHNIPFHCYYWKDNNYTVGAFSQDTARKWRRNTMKSLLNTLLHEQQQSASAAAVVRGILLTAHHLDDSNESLLLKLVRGTHLTHLRGMELVHMEDNSDNHDESRIIVWGRPLLTIPKANLVQYLQERQYEWREDSSNQSNKYLRNRIRNELVPLLTDLMSSSSGSENGSEAKCKHAIFQKRLDHLSQQSRIVERHLTQLAQQQYLDVQSSTESDSLCFHLPSSWPIPPFSCNAVLQQALHLWVTQTSRSLSATAAAVASTPTAPPTPTVVDFNYGQLLRVCQQLDNYPRNKQWSLDIGQQWSIVRRGGVLLLEHPYLTQNQRQTEGCQQLSWTIDDGASTQASDHATTAEFQILLHVSPSLLTSDTSFVRTTVSALSPSSSSSITFHPPWRDHPILLKDFWRGQKVPLHQRLELPVILLQAGLGQQELPVTPKTQSPPVVIVAAFVPTKNAWVVSKSFAPTSDPKDSIPIGLHLG